MFQSHGNTFKYSLRVKHYLSEVINKCIFTSGDNEYHGKYAIWVPDAVLYEFYNNNDKKKNK